MLAAARGAISAKIAAGLSHALARRSRLGASGGTDARMLAQGEKWSVRDVTCTSGPSDRSFEEQHKRVSIAIVAAGTFQYRTRSGDALLTPGSMMLGNPGDCFECGHQHATGDRCVSFHYAPEYFERIVVDAGASPRGFRVPRLPPLADTARVVASAGAGISGADIAWDELAVRLAVRVASAADGTWRHRPASAAAMRRVTDVVRAMAVESSATLRLDALAAMAGLSPFHFLRTFEAVTGVTPHQYVRRMRLREAAMQLSSARARVIDVAFESGFADLSAFNRAFRSEFGITPRAYRREERTRAG